MTRAQRAEWKRCKRSPAYFLERWGFVYDATSSGWVRFELWPAQRDVLVDLEQQLLMAILKARQLGLSWLVVGWALWLMLFRPACTVLFFSKRDQEAVHLLAFRLRGMLDRLPEWMQPGLTQDNDHNVEFGNGSVAMAFPTTGGRSYTASLVVVDEADFAEKLDDLLAAVKPTIDAGGRLVLLSTADKSRPISAFKRIYGAGRDGRNGYKAVFLPWWARPGRTPEWYEEQRRDILERTAATDDLYQEYPATEFEALAPRVLDRRFAAEWLVRCDGTAVAGISGENWVPSRVKSGENWVPSGESSGENWVPSRVKPGENWVPSVPGLVVWRAPKAGESFVIGADPAEGNPQSDDSAASVLDLLGEQVAVWAGRVEPSTFGDQIGVVSAFFNDAPVLVERNNHGHAVLLRLRESTGVRILLGLDGKPGWSTTGVSKPMAFDNAAEVFRGVGAVLRDKETLAQLASITVNLAAPDGMKDDRAMAEVLGLAALRFCSVGPVVSASIPPVDVIEEADREKRW